MLVLSRKVGERIVIGDEITVVVNRVSGNRVSLGIDAPEHVRIVRGELAKIVSEFDDRPGEASEASFVVMPRDDNGVVLEQAPS